MEKELEDYFKNIPINELIKEWNGIKHSKDSPVIGGVKIYLVKYTTGDLDGWAAYDIFSTFNKDKAIEYVNKFNTKLKKWKKYMRQYDSKPGGHHYSIPKRSEEIPENVDYRYYQILETREAYITEIEIR